MTSLPLSVDEVERQRAALQASPPPAEEIQKAKRSLVRLSQDAGLEVTDEMITLYMALRAAAPTPGARISVALTKSWKSRLQVEKVCTRTVYIQQKCKLEVPESALKKYLIRPECVEFPTALPVPFDQVAGLNSPPTRPSPPAHMTVLAHIGRHWWLCLVCVFQSPLTIAHGRRIAHVHARSHERLEK